MTAYTLYADEAWTHDPELRHWRFYGGALLRSALRPALERDLLGLKEARGLHGEVKWSYTTTKRFERFGEIVERFLDYVDAGDVKLRYMWLDQRFQDPDSLTAWHHDYGYYILYYYFVVFGFGLPWHDERERVDIEFFPDNLPDELEKRAEFRRFLLTVHQRRRFERSSPFRLTNVTSVESVDHIILQCVDVITGAVGYKLNKQFKAKPGKRRSQTAPAKIALYERIRDRLGVIDMGERGGKKFSIGVNTGTGTEAQNRWRHNFRQWDFRRPGVFNPNWERD